MDTNDEATKLPDGSAFFTLETPLPKDHWLYEKHDLEAPPMPMRTGTDDHSRKWYIDAIRDAGKYALRSSIESPDEVGFDPDALIQNLIVGLLGYHTPTGLSEDDHLNPKPGENNA